MSVLIKGMEMPKSCAECQMGDPVRCVLMPGVPAWWAEYDQCVIEKRLHSHCPLVTVPPHGALKDADALMCEWEVATNANGERFPAVSLEKIQAAPTIIPADHIVDDTKMVEAEEGE